MTRLPGDDPRQVLHRDAKAVGIKACIAVRTEMLVQQAEEATGDRGSVCGRRLYRPSGVDSTHLGSEDKKERTEYLPVRRMLRARIMAGDGLIGRLEQVALFGCERKEGGVVQLLGQ